MPMDRDQFIEHYKKGHTVHARQDVWNEGMSAMIEELLIAAEPVVKEAVAECGGEINNMWPEYQGIYEVYKSWDHFNKGRGRETTEEMLSQYPGASTTEEENDVTPDD